MFFGLFFIHKSILFFSFFFFCLQRQTNLNLYVSCPRQVEREARVGIRQIKLPALIRKLLVINVQHWVVSEEQ